MMWKVYIGNLDSRIKEIELADEFRAYGTVRSVWVARNPPGYAFVEFDNRRDAEDAVSGLDGRHGWRVEMSHKSVGGTGSSRASHGSESKCYDSGTSGHFARECRYRGSRHSYRRSPSPHSRSTSHRDNISRLDRDDGRSRHDRSCSYDERVDPPKKRRERCRSRESDVSDSSGYSPCRRRRELTNSPLNEKSDIARTESETKAEERSISPVSNSPKKESERSRSPCDGVSDTDGDRIESERREETRSLSPVNNSSETIRKGSERSRPPCDGIPDTDRDRTESEKKAEARSVSPVSDSPKKESERSGSPCDGISDIDRSVPWEHNKPVQPDDCFVADGKSLPNNGCYSANSPQEDQARYYKDRSPMEEIEAERNGDSS